ncbi:MAG: HAD family hydrolase [Dehalococcoidia bacterium]|nr:HAD family hydrolase [Dehalococcoidia bacterium]
MKKYNVVIFDWDGTLWNSWQAHEEALQYAAAQAGCPAPTSEAIAECHGLPLAQIITQLFPGRSEEVTQSYLGHYERGWRATSSLFPKVEAMLVGLREKGYRLALFSNKPRWAAVPELAVAGVGRAFVVDAFGDEVARAKPEPDGVQHVLKVLGSDPSQALYVGDTHADMRCAQQAGVGFAAALWGSKAPHTIPTAPDMAWQHPREALARL